MSLPMHLRTYREKSRDESSRDFFNVPTLDAMPGPGEPPSVTKIRNVKEVSEKEKDKGQQGMEINAVLSVEGKEEVYVSQDLNREGVGLMIRRGGYLYYRLSCVSFRSIGNLVDVHYLCILLGVLKGKSRGAGKAKLMTGLTRELECLRYH
jgi:hypothetical protein